MTDITPQLLLITQTYKAPLKSAYQERFQPSEISASDSHFMNEAGKLHFSLVETHKMLNSLFKLTKQNTLFNNQSSRIHQLSEQIEDSIKVSQIKLEEVRGVQIGGECAEIIKEILQQRLLSLIKDFQKLLQTRTKLLKDNKLKQKEISSVNEVELSRRDTPSFLEVNNVQEQIDDLSELQARADSVEQVEKQMAEVSQMVQRLALIVHEQQLMVERIDQNTDQALLNLEKGKQEIEKYHQNVTSNRNLGIKVFMIFVIFFVFYVIFLV
ncbi:STX5 [Blepharisma stoltei]|uniref:t-SNARE coiled-coil homology domain-containing protein n=1 Tax=Blepharisma stoltei TaxID=1481888 RepID=A0AAU9JSA0_9CILI|nr:unnamed protein product [Blepharisma stoltei]